MLIRNYGQFLALKNLKAVLSQRSEFVSNQFPPIGFNYSVFINL